MKADSILKNKKLYVGFILLFSFIITISVSSKTSSSSGKVFKIDGKYAFYKMNKKWRRLKTNTKIYNNIEIKTGSKTRVVIKFNDNSELRVAQKSKIKINKSFVKSPENREISARLLFGKLWAKVSKSKNKNRNFNVTTETATAGVRGTTFNVTFKEDKTSIVSLYTGSVEVEPNKDKADNKRDLRNYDKRKRKEVAGPKEVSLKKWNKIILTQMQRVEVSSNGDMKKSEIDKEEEKIDEWIAWNMKLDQDKETSENQ